MAALQLTAAALAAQRPAVTDLFPARPTGFVTDVAGAVDPGSAARMTELIERLRAASGAEIAVVTLPTIDGYSEAEVALAIGRTWGVGARAGVGDQRRNASVVILLVPREAGREGSGYLRVEVGQGLEGILTDATAGRVRDLIVGSLQGENYGPALLAGVEALVGVIARGMGVSDSALTNARPVPVGGAPAAPSIRGMLPMILMVLFFLMVSGAFGRRGRRRRVYWGGPWIGGGGFGGGWGGGGGFGGGGFGGFGGGGGFSGGGAGGRF